MSMRWERGRTGIRWGGKGGKNEFVFGHVGFKVCTYDTSSQR